MVDLGIIKETKMIVMVRFGIKFFLKICNASRNSSIFMVNKLLEKLVLSIQVTPLAEILAIAIVQKGTS